MDDSMKQQIAQWLSLTTGSDESALRSATAHLESAQKYPGFALCLLRICQESKDHGLRIASVTYLKNFVRNLSNNEILGDSNERQEFRNQLVHLLLQVDASLLKLFAEVFHLVIAKDFVLENKWTELIPSLRAVIQSSDMLASSASSPWKTLNALVALQTLIKPFQYFMNPKLAREPVPEQLELITKELLVPSHGIFHLFIEKAQTTISNGDDLVEKENVLLTLCKCFYLAVRSHMPVSLMPSLSIWFEDFVVLLNSINLEKPIADAEKCRFKAAKRTLQIFCTLVTRHRKHTDKFMPDMIKSALRLIKQRLLNDQFLHLRERVASLAFDVVAHVLETGPGWRFVSPHFSSLLETAIFPALQLNEKDMVEWEHDADEYLSKNLPSEMDMVEWEHDADEYLSKNLPSEMDEVSGWKADLYTIRKSALNLMSVIALSKGPPTSATPNKVAPNKRKKGRGKDHGLAGELLVIPFLSRFALPPDGSMPMTDAVKNYYAVLLAYGSLQEFFKAQSAEYITLLLQTRVLPLYLMSSPSPYLIANANWLLGEFATCLPTELNQNVYSSLLKAFVAPDEGNQSWHLVRASAAGAICAFLQEDYTPPDWLTFLQVCVNGISNGTEACLSLRLLSNAAEVCSEGVVCHIPAIFSTIKGEITKQIPLTPEPWPQVVELGFSALSAIAKCWDNADLEENEPVLSLEDWNSGCISISNTVLDLLQEAWLSHLQDATKCETLPPNSCLNDVSLLLSLVLKYVCKQKSPVAHKLEALLQVWADLIADWSAWDEEEDLAVFDAIEEAFAFNEACHLKNFTMADVPPPPAPPIARRSICEGIATFICSAIEFAYSAAAWRACYLSHSLLHIPKFSVECEALRQTIAVHLTQSAYARYQSLKSKTVPLAKPLTLVIAACYLCFPAVEKVFSDNTIAEGSSNGFLKWITSVVCLVNSSSTSEPVLVESELKLVVMTLVKVMQNLEELGNNNDITEVKCTCVRSLLEGLIQLKAIQETEDASEDEDMENGDDSDDENDELESDEDDEESEDEEYEETEEQFLERYAQTARDLEKEIIENVEGGDEEDGKEIELGCFSMEDPKDSAFSVLKKYIDRPVIKEAVPQDLISRFSESFPEIIQLLNASF